MPVKKSAKPTKKVAAKPAKKAAPAKKAVAKDKKSSVVAMQMTSAAPQRSGKPPKVAKPPSAAPAATPLETAKKALAKEKTAKETVPVATGPMAAKWLQFYKKAETIETKPYNMRQTFLEKTAIVHKVLGWGYIMANRNDRLEVLFKDGIKYLISNYK